MCVKVSIVIPVYNVESYLEQCLNSAINQSLSKNDIEIITINDGSTDNSLNILKKYASKYSNIKLINQDNKGLSNARNIGLNHSNGEYIYFLDSDDYIDLKSMEYCYQIAKEDNLDIVTFDAEIVLENINNKKVINNYDRKKLLKSNVMSGSEFFCYSWRRKGYRVPVWINLYKTDFLKKNNLFFKEGIIHEDELHTVKAFILASKVKYIQKKIFYRRIRDNSIMTKEISKKNIDSMYIIAQELYKFYEDKKLNLDRYVKKQLLKVIIDDFSKALKYNDEFFKFKTHQDSRRKIILKGVKENKLKSSFKFKMQIKIPIIYYRLENIEKNIKNIVKTFI